jgi:uncharacterized cupin superfamily protein
MMKLGEAHVRREALFGGDGAVSVWDLMRGKQLAPFTAVLACELEPGGSVGTHLQEQFPEIVIVTEGDGRIVVNDEAHEVGAGYVVPLPLGHSLSISNLSREQPLRYLIIKAATEA